MSGSRDSVVADETTESRTGLAGARVFGKRGENARGRGG